MDADEELVEESRLGSLLASVLGRFPDAKLELTRMDSGALDVVIRAGSHFVVIQRTSGGPWGVSVDLPSDAGFLGHDRSFAELEEVSDYVLEELGSVEGALPTLLGVFVHKSTPVAEEVRREMADQLRRSTWWTYVERHASGETSIRGRDSWSDGGAAVPNLLVSAAFMTHWQSVWAMLRGLRRPASLPANLEAFNLAATWLRESVPVGSSAAIVSGRATELDRFEAELRQLAGWSFARREIDEARRAFNAVVESADEFTERS